ncbi:CRISPR-associated helicase Cas3' [uncultured Acidaminococcus sp.]|jgi:CRISPR-associated endonuclease/helicase Cas3|uniref:CRISPR-associated helicase Cas3' n=1 Tax=uncultured Acidaminococcus sp. TaxID=352152 RepID=UPI002583C1FA|nr:CRISPR-associated helicase Cas3' [uncultured Acidaminococcus sp.]
MTIRAVWDLPAKANRKNPDEWLPLWMHLRDTAAVMDYLISVWLPDSVKKAINPAGNEEQLWKMAVLLGALHDLGKATPAFCSMILQNIEGIENQLEEEGLPISGYKVFTSRKTSPHPIAGEAVLLARDFPLCFAAMVGAHHGKPHAKEGKGWEKKQLSPYSIHHINYYDRSELDMAEQWKEMRSWFIEQGFQLAGISSPQDIPEISMPAQVLLTGLLIMADWIASNEIYFPLISVDKCGEEIDYAERIENGLSQLELPPPWNSQCYSLSDQTFAEHFGFLPNSVQRAVIEAVEQARNPGIFVLEAQMGVGKTEAALAAADLLASRKGSGGLFFGLPTQATSNGIFPRIADWAAEEAQAETASLGIRLAHGAAEMNDDYRSIFHGTASTDEDGEPLLVHPWFEGRKQALLTDFVIGTVDQLLLAALKQKHVMLRHLGLAGKVVIVDECHAYDTYMNQFLGRAMAWLGAYQVPVVLLSATLPYARRTALIQAYQGIVNADSGAGEPWMTSKEYPLLTWTDGNQVKQKKIPVEGTSKEVRLQRISDADIPDILKHRLGAGGCAGIIVNTVKRAQQLALHLKDSLPEDEIILFHAGFILGQKTALEKEILKRIGKKSGENRNNLVVVGTQVMEQSLDIDLDLLLTDLCPMDLLFQRIGRLHRHARKRPDGLKQATCMILGAKEDEELDEGAKAVYEEYLLLRTKELLPDRFILPDDISPYVQDVYDESYSIAPEKEREAKVKYDQHMADEKNAAKTNCVPLPRKTTRFKARNTLEGWLDNTPAMNEIQAEASVRNGPDSIEVILLEKDLTANALKDVWPGNQRFAWDEPLNNADALRVYQQKIRLPARFGQPWMVQKVIQELEKQTKQWVSQWLKNPYLSGELFLVLEENGKGKLAGYEISYDPLLGLIYEKESGE